MFPPTTSSFLPLRAYPFLVLPSPLFFPTGKPCLWVAFMPRYVGLLRQAFIVYVLAKFKCSLNRSYKDKPAKTQLHSHCEYDAYTFCSTFILYLTQSKGSLGRCDVKMTSFNCFFAGFLPWKSCFRVFCVHTTNCIFDLNVCKTRKNPVGWAQSSTNKDSPEGTKYT